MQVPAGDSTVLILGQSLWADTTQPPQPGHGLAVSGGRILAVGPHERAYAVREELLEYEAEAGVKEETAVP